MKRLNSYKKYQTNDEYMGYTIEWANDGQVSGYLNPSKLSSNMMKIPPIHDIENYFNYATAFHNLKSHFNTLTGHLKLALTVEEKLEEYILEEYIQGNFDKDYIQECGSYIYQKIQDQAYDFAYKVIEEAEKDCYMNAVDEDSLVEHIMDNIDFNSLYDLIENISQAPITMEEKLSEIGMSNKDFL